jgi:hypothetical protein
MILNFSRDALVGLPVLKEKLGLTGSGFSLGALSDVSISPSPPEEGDMLQYNAVLGKWVNGGGLDWTIALDGPF